MSDPLDMATAQLAQLVLAEETLETVLDKVLRLAKQTIPAADAVSCTLVRDDQGWTPAYTDDLGLKADELQYLAGRGPCLDAGRTGSTLVIEDMTTDQRWPDYCPHAAEIGALSSGSFPMPVQTEVLGAINVYSRHKHGFDEQAVRTGEMFASYAAIAVANAQALHGAAAAARQMREAMASRAAIEQAKGIVMAERRVSAEDAFTILVRASQHSNRKLRDVALELVGRFAPQAP